MPARRLFVVWIAVAAGCGTGDHELVPDAASDGESQADARGPHEDGSVGDKDSSAKDANPSHDGSLEAEADAARDTVAPRPIAPLSTSRVTSRRPKLHWELPTGVADATVDLCSDRACTQPIGTPAHVTGKSYAPPVELPIGVVYWRLHPGTRTSVTSPTWQFTVGARSAPVDTSWGTTLDVNGDGYADLAVGADVLADDTGSVYVYLGSANGLASKPTPTLSAPAGENSVFGVSVASAGDVNGDGYADLVVGSQGVSSNVGRAYVYLGGPNGIQTTEKPTSIPNPDAAGGLFGSSVAGIGDVNGDGYADVVIGANEGEISGASGQAYVYLGSANGLATLPVKTLPAGSLAKGAGDVNGDGYGDLILGAPGVGIVYVYVGGANGLALAPTLTGPTGSAFGASVASAGDLNGDGYADILVGAAEDSNAMGTAAIYFGGVDGLGSSPLTLTDPNNHEQDIFGESVASAGDWNGDGYADVAIGAGNSSSSGGTVYVYLGSATLDTGPTPTPAKTLIDTLNFGDLSFGNSVGAGDVNGSGLSVLIVGAWTAVTNDAGISGGAAYIYSALATTPSLTLTGPENSYFGISVFGASD